MVAVAAVLGGIGLVCVLFRSTVLGVLVGIQLFLFGAGLLFVSAGIQSGAQTEGYSLALFIALAAVAQLVAGLALASGIFGLKKDASLSGLNELKH